MDCSIVKCYKKVKINFQQTYKPMLRLLNSEFSIISNTFTKFNSRYFSIEILFRKPSNRNDSSDASEEFPNHKLNSLNILCQNKRINKFFFLCVRKFSKLISFRLIVSNETNAIIVVIVMC